MWFVSKQQYQESLIEREGLKDRLLRSMAAVRNAEMERDQANALANNLEAKLAAALQDVANAEHEIEKAEQQVTVMRHERDALQAKLHSIQEILGAEQFESNGRGPGSRLMGSPLSNGMWNGNGES